MMNISYLQKFCDMMHVNNNTSLLLKSYYSTEIRKRISNNKLYTINRENICMKCSVPWSNGNFSIKFVPPKNKKLKAQRLDKKIKKSDIKFKTNESNSLQYPYGHVTRSIAIIRCLLCKSKSKILIKNKLPNGKSTNNDIRQKLVRDIKSEGKTSTGKISKLKNKKKKKDKTAGLIIPLELNYSPSKKAYNKISKQTIEKKTTNIGNTTSSLPIIKQKNKLLQLVNAFNMHKTSDNMTGLKKLLN